MKFSEWEGGIILWGVFNPRPLLFIFFEIFLERLNFKSHLLLRYNFLISGLSQNVLPSEHSFFQVSDCLSLLLVYNLPFLVSFDFGPNLQAHIATIIWTQAFCITPFSYVEIKGGVLSAMVIILGNGISDPSSNPEWGYLHFTLHLCPWKRHDSIASPYSLLSLFLWPPALVKLPLGGWRFNDKHSTRSSGLVKLSATKSPGTCARRFGKG